MNKMNKAKIVIGIGMVLAVLAVFTASAAAGNYFYLVPQNSSCGPNESVLVSVVIHLESTDTDNQLGSAQAHIDFNPSVVNVTNVVEPVDKNDWDLWDWRNKGNYAFIWANEFGGFGPGEIYLGNMTLKCISPGVSPLEYTHFYPQTPDPTLIGDKLGEPVPFYAINGTFACNKSLPVGWNLVSRPDVTADNSTASVLSGVSYDAVYRYDATTKDWVNVTEGTMDPGIGYFVHVTAPSNWTFTGTPYTQMNISLKPGLNMIGWLDCSKSISDILTSEDHWYATTFNASEQKYTDTFNPVAPDVFNRLTTMEPGAGYFISAKQSGWLNVSC